MAQRTRSRVSAATWGSSLKTRDTVLALTPATRATSRMVVMVGLRVPPGGSAGDSGRSAGGLVDRLLSGRGIHVVLGDDGELGADLRGGRLAGQGRVGLVHRVGPDRVRGLGDERLHGALLERGDLVRLGVEADDLDLARLAGLTDAGGGALGREQVGREDADDAGVLLQRR